MEPQIENEKKLNAKEKKSLADKQRRELKGAEIRQKQRESYYRNKEKISEARKRKNFEKTGGRTVGRPRKAEDVKAPE